MVVARAESIRLAEVLTALSLASDIGHEQPLEKSLRTTVLAVRLAVELDVRAEDLTAVYYVTLLRSIGCTASAHETALLFGGDDNGVLRIVQLLSGGQPRDFFRALVRHTAGSDPHLASLHDERWWYSEGGRQVLRAARDSACEVGIALVRRVGLPAAVQQGLDHTYERWDGKGIGGIGGERLSYAARISHVADIAEIAARSGGMSAAVDIVRERTGSHFEPDIAATFIRCADSLLANLNEGADMLEFALDAEPTPHQRRDRTALPEIARAIADFADLKSPWMHGYSPAVARLAAEAARPEESETLLLAGLVHDVGRVAVPTGIWERAGSLGSAQWERVRLHSYYTERILRRTPAFRHVAALAGAHHERLDGSGYHSGTRGNALSEQARLLAASDAYTAMCSARPHRPALAPEVAAAELEREARAGAHCAHAVAAVLQAAGQRASPRPALPRGISEREAEVLVLVAFGLTNKQIAAELILSPRTVQRHLENIYDKIDCRTRAGAAMFAMEHNIIGPGQAGRPRSIFA